MTTAEDTKPEHVLPLFERVLEWRYALLMVSLVLAIDVARVLLHAMGFPPFDWFALQTSVPLGTVLVFIAVYFFFMAGLSLFIQVLLEYVLAEVGIQSLLQRLFARRFDPTHSARMSRYGYALVSDVEALALRQRDDFWIKRVNEDKVLANAKASSVRFMVSLSFSCTLLIFLECLMRGPTYWQQLPLDWSPDSIEMWTGVFTATVAVVSFTLVIWPWCNHFLDGGDDRRWMKHPELAAEACKKIEEKRVADEEFQRQLYAAQFDRSKQELRQRGQSSVLIR